VDGKRDGPGIVSVRTSGTWSGHDRANLVTEGSNSLNYVRGVEVGLFCELSDRWTNSAGTTEHAHGQCTLMSGGVAISPSYLKQPDGRWRLVDNHGQPIEPADYLPAGSLEAESARLIANAREGKPSQAP